MPRWSPCRLGLAGAADSRLVPPANYRNGMPGDTTDTPIRTTVVLSAPNRTPNRPTPERPAIESAVARARLRAAETALLDERRLLTGSELAELAELTDQWVTSLAALAHQVRLAWCGPEVEVEGILSAKTGGCPEDCHFCSQSSRFDTPVKATPFLDADEVLRAAEETRAAGASEFCIVLAVRGPDERTVRRILELVPMIHDRTGLNVAVSAGLLTDEQARRFAAGGVHRYNHNLETSRSFFPNVVTTHTWEERQDTCRLVRHHGMELCCGALLGMGESEAQRIELLVQLQELDPTEVPLNFLNPRPGTPLGDEQPVPAWEAIRWIALFRLGLPGVILRYAGGREVTLRELQSMGMTSGINALIVGNYLTTLGRSADEDLQMLSDLRMPVGALTGVL
jgi:biotin synthase